MLNLTRLRWLAVLVLVLIGTDTGRCALAGWQPLKGHVPQIVNRLAAMGRLSGTNQLNLAIGLQVRNESALNELIHQLYDPASTNFHRFLTPQEFARQFGPTDQEYLAVQEFARSNGLVVVGTHLNHLVLDVAGPAAAAERAFQVTLHRYQHPTERRTFFAPDAEPSVPANLPVADMWGLSDYGRPRSMAHRVDPLKVRAQAGSGPSGYYAGNDFRKAYAPGTILTGAGQSVGLLQFDGYNKSDITNYENLIGLTNYVPLKNVLVNFFNGAAGSGNDEVCLDIEMAIAMAPGLSQVIVYEIGTVSPNSILSRMANDNLAKQLSSSWAWSGGPSSSVDTILKQMATQGQCFFVASGDGDAYTGVNVLDTSSSLTEPADSTNVVSVGATTLSMNGSGVSWSSETVWNFNNLGGTYAGIGSSGGSSSYYKIPYWQTNVDMTTNLGSTTFRNLPDVAMVGNNVYVVSSGGSTGGFAGTSCAAPLWAGFTALINQQAVAGSGSPVGFLNPAFYAIGTGTNYAANFHDTKTGDNIGTNTAGLYPAVNGFDLCTGWGTPNGTNLINTLAPRPGCLVQPTNKIGLAGSNVSLSVTAGGQKPLAYRWLYNGADLTVTNSTGNLTSILTLTNLTATNAGNYSVVVTNIYGATTSSVAALTVASPPAITVPPASQTVMTGSNASFSVTAAGTARLAFQWLKNGANLVNGTGVAGATTNQLALTSVTTNTSGNYSVVVTNLYGSATSSVVALNVVQAPVINTPVSGQSVECSSNATFMVSATGIPAPGYQWTLDGSALAGATNAVLLLTNVHQPGHTVSVLVTNLYGAVTNTVTLTVNDTKAPVLGLNGGNPLYLELGAAFNDPGATATDACAGAVSVTVTGSVNTNLTGTNLLFYLVQDGNGNSNSLSRTVIVRDTTPPVILWSFTNLVLAADTNCAAVMIDITGQNYILATDMSGPTTITQSPGTNATLFLGTNTVVLAVADASGNTAYSTNTITVQDQAAPVLASQPQSQTNTVGSTAIFTLTATACTPLTYQWLFNQNGLSGQTNATLTLTNLAMANAGNYSVVAQADGGSATSSVASLTVQPAIIPVVLTVSENPGGGIFLNLTGPGGAYYVLEMTSDLLSSNSWKSLNTNILSENGDGQFADLSATNDPQRYYRARLFQ